MRALLVLLLIAPIAHADAPTASCVFPAGGRRGTTVAVRVAGLNLFERCGWDVTGQRLALSPHLVRTRTRWFEGPVLPLPDSQRQEDYPQDMAGTVRIAADAPLGVRRVRVWTSEGASAGPVFVVGDLAEVVEEEADGDPVPVKINLPVTVNGRIFPREDVDDWTFDAKKGQTVTAEVHAARIGSKLDARLELFAPDGKRLAENDDHRGTDPLLRFTAPADGTYRLRISDSLRGGSQCHVYRLTVTAGPFVDYAYPAGGRVGVKTKFALSGANLPAAEKELTLPASLPGFTPDADTLPEFLEGAGPFAPPGVINGRISKPGESDTWHFQAKKGQALEFSVRDIGSPLLPAFAIEADGKALSTPSGPRWLFSPPRDGGYVLRIRDRFASRGGPAFLYRVRVSPAVPSFRLTMPLSATLLRGRQAKVPLLVERRGGFSGPITVSAAGLPKGVTAAPLTIGPGQPRADLLLKADGTAPIGPVKATITGTAGELRRTATSATLPGETPIAELLLGIGLVAPFKYAADYDLRLAPRGSTFRKKFRVVRDKGFTGALEARLADHQNRHLQGVTGPVLSVPATADLFEYPVFLPPWMEIGRTSRSVVVLVGKVKVDGALHTVSYSAQGQPDQIIAVVETGRLGLDLQSATLSPRGGEVSFRVRRGKDTAGPVSVSLVVPAHVRGVQCATAAVGAKETAGKLHVRVAPGAGPFNMPLTVRAELKVAGGVMVAEAPLEVVKE